MSKLQKKLYLGILIVVFFSVFWLEFNQTESATTKKYISIQKAEFKKNTESVIILAGQTKLKLSTFVNTTLFDLLIQTRNTGKIALAGKNYPGLGFFVTDIGPLHSGGERNLLYYINGKEATVGVSSYILKDGDVIEWKLK